MAKKPVVSVPTIEDMMGAIEEGRARMEVDAEFAQELREGRPSGNPISLGPRLPTAEEHTKLQIAGASANASKWLARTIHPKKNFKEEALKANDRYKNSMQEVISKDLWKGGMENVDESEALSIVEKVGSGAYSGGIAAREAKILRVNKELREDRLSLCSSIDAMGVATDAEREAKMIANKRGLQAIGLRRRGVK